MEKFTFLIHTLPTDYSGYAVLSLQTRFFNSQILLLAISASTFDISRSLHPIPKWPV